MRNAIVKFFVAATIMIAGAFVSNAQPGGGFQFDPNEIAKMRADDMKQTVKLTDDQYTKVVALFKAEMENMQKMFEGGGMPDMDAMQKQREEQNKKLKAILTEDQFKKWQKQQEEMRAQFGGGGF